ncbi:hypothetical protein P344_06750 [Spiroplasma mirum ATCC 29335]|uniref:Uncharacterized protein n=1 Tax=Spiroplasma mirum ATCC 29335 TaxID=838561 RepID=W0GQX8_9MOLU|nr:MULTISPECIES: hypothetical protein [Spiroplasma]AHF61503.1 hypothetical protein SMM_1134 [Spiroplasma mirum ATCC 29335]AHI58648.1 hypothetical protein P344_06750 [Spiroplasma mirum ATCC 29335]
MQLFFNVLITQINTVVIIWYLDGLYFPVVTKATIAFNFLQFTPSLIASGTLIVCGNLIGQQWENELSDVIVSGYLAVNFFNLYLFSIYYVYDYSVLIICFKCSKY